MSLNVEQLYADISNVGKVTIYPFVNFVSRSKGKKSDTVKRNFIVIQSKNGKYGIKKDFNNKINSNELPLLIVYKDNAEPEQQVLNSFFDSINSVNTSSSSRDEAFIYITKDSINIITNHLNKIDELSALIKKLQIDIKDKSKYTVNVLTKFDNPNTSLSSMLDAATLTLFPENGKINEKDINKKLNKKDKTIASQILSYLEKMNDSAKTKIEHYINTQRINAVGDDDQSNKIKDIYKKNPELKALFDESTKKGTPVPKLFDNFVQWAEEKGLANIKGITDKIFFGMMPTLIGNIPEQGRINRIVIEGPPGTGKTFTAGLLMEYLEQNLGKIMNVPFKSITETASVSDISATTNNLLGSVSLKSDGQGGTETTVSYGSLIYALRDIVRQANNLRKGKRGDIIGLVSIFFNESNLNVGRGFEQILRSIKDNNKLLIENLNIPDNEAKIIRQELKNEFGINAKVTNTSIEVDLNNVDGNGLKVHIVTVETINKGVEYGGKDMDPATSSRVKFIRVKLPDPSTTEGKEIIYNFISNYIDQHFIPLFLLEAGYCTGPDLQRNLIYWDEFLNKNISGRTNNKDKYELPELNTFFMYIEEIKKATFTSYLTLYSEKDSIGFTPPIVDVIPFVTSTVISLLTEKIYENDLSKVENDSILSAYSPQDFLSKYVKSGEEELYGDTIKQLSILLSRIQSNLVKEITKGKQMPNNKNNASFVEVTKIVMDRYEKYAKAFVKELFIEKYGQIVQENKIPYLNKNEIRCLSLFIDENSKLINDEKKDKLKKAIQTNMKRLIKMQQQSIDRGV